LHDEKDGFKRIVELDFRGKDSVRYYNEVRVNKRVFKNLKIFMEGKKKGDDLFDRLTVSLELWKIYIAMMLPVLCKIYFNFRRLQP